eukprot:CAMPEP_0174251876 /NCGR_PEP_ID=MMETSP0439-20130205/1566_1 /TAXON_ID=0 /ORGANISM="Stereomyxa ramosa, Strain Chinc5" /LENGTH=184 /DNA_ID=CAMNT_0015332313 /DNA_START=37 /DNA_END=591 /DNA_ORIENTATION=+
MGGFLSSDKPVNLVMVGLDNAGKTTILFQLKLGEVVRSAPTIGFNVEVVQYKSLQCTVWDVGGQSKIRTVWKHYYKSADGIIFVIDSNDRQRLDEAAMELKNMFETSEQLNGAFLLIFANKQDLGGAAKVPEILEALQLDTIKGAQNHYVQPCCATTGEGIHEGFEWIADKLGANADTSSCVLQ